MKHVLPKVFRVGNPLAVAIACLMFLIPALGVPSLLVLQDTFKSSVAAIGILSIALLFCCRKGPDTDSWRWHSLMWLPLALMLYALGSMAWGHAYLAGVEAIRWFLLGLLMWLALNIIGRDDVSALAWGLHLGAGVASGWAALQFWFGWQFFPQGPQPASTFVNRNFFAEYAVCIFPVSVWLLATLRSTRGLGWMALSLGFNLVVILMTGTRSALAALVVVVPMLCSALWLFRAQFAWSQWSGRQRLLVAVVLALSVGLLGSLPTGNPQIAAENLGRTALQRGTLRASSMALGSEYTQGTFSVRAQMWMATARMLLAHPLTGVGAGAWEVEIPLYQRVDTVLETDYYAHNEYLQLLSEYGGVVGGVVLAILVAYLLHSVLATWRLRDSGAVEAPPRVFALGPLMALAIVSNAGFPWHLAACGTLIAICLGVLAASDSRLNLQDTLRAGHITIRPAHRLCAGAGLAVCLVVAVCISVQAARSESHLVRAIQQATAYAHSVKSSPALAAAFKSDALWNATQGVTLNPHYRKLTAEVAEPFSAAGDWVDAVWLLESIAASRPHVAAIWSGLALGYTALGEPQKAEHALAEVKRLKPDALRTVTLEAAILGQSGQGTRAAQLLNAQFDTGTFDYDMVQTAYAIGYRTQQWALAIRAQELRIARWPQHSADGYFRLGLIYADPKVRDDARALASFRAGWNQVPPEQRDNYRQQVPQPFRDQL